MSKEIPLKTLYLPPPLQHILLVPKVRLSLPRTPLTGPRCFRYAKLGSLYREPFYMTSMFQVCKDLSN